MLPKAIRVLFKMTYHFQTIFCAKLIVMTYGTAQRQLHERSQVMIE